MTSENVEFRSRMKIRGKPNACLSKEERDHKRQMKKKLRTLTKINTLEKRLKHAQGIKNSIVEQNTLVELAQYREKASAIGLTNVGTSILANCNNPSMKRDSFVKEVNRKFILSVSIQLFATQVDKALILQKNLIFDPPIEQLSKASNSENHLRKLPLQRNGLSAKEHQTECASKLLKAMTKGEQQRHMFEDPSTLWGYTRQKFNERATLLATSLRKLSLDPNCEEINCLTSHELDLKQKVWNVLRHKKIRNVISVGCGPGNDAVGVISLLATLSENEKYEEIGILDETHSNLSETFQKEKTQYKYSDKSPVIRYLIENLVLLDWAIPEWDSAILQPLWSILKKMNIVENMKCNFCDVTKSFFDESNHFMRMSLAELHKADGRTPQVNVTKLCTPKSDIILVSYLLSETRGKWEAFFSELISYSISGTIFYFAEPVPWQLHRFCTLFGSQLDFLWIDSSMNCPTLRDLDRRIGPAILLAVKM